MDSGRHKQPKGPGDSRDSKGSKAAKDPKGQKGQESVAPGQIPVDDRGRNVWHFHGESIDSTSMMLQRLENPALALDPTLKTRQLDAEPTAGKSPGGKAVPGKAQAGKSPPGKSPPGKSAGGKSTGESTQSFQQRFQVKPGKNSGGGFDPYNRS